MSINLPLSRIFLVSTDSNFSQHLATIYSSKFELSIFENWESSLQNIHQRPSVIFLDIKNELASVVPFLNKMLDFDKNIPIILILENNNITDYKIISKSNIYNCFQKEELTDHRLHFLLKNVGHSSRLHHQLERLEVNRHHDIVKSMVYNCARMQRVTQLINKATLTNLTCYISGEQGTGKGAAAYLIHQLSNRKSFPYIYLKLSRIEIEDLEKEFFGFENHQNRVLQKGKLELATTGTLYLEDIHLMPLPLQSKFLEVIKSGHFQRVGGTEKVPFNIRLITSTPRHLLEEVEGGHFLESLYYRLIGLPINIPSLKDRGNDIILLANNFMSQFSDNNNFPEKLLSKAAKQKLLSHSFPGNIRELKSTMESAMVLADGNTILEDDLEFGNASNQISFSGQEMAFEEYKSKIIHHFLNKYKNDIQVVSTKLDIGKSTIYRMLKSEKEKGTKKIDWLNMF
jgi:two-component system response regulator AtoC